MFLRRKQKSNDDEQPIPHVWSWQATKREEVGRSKTRTALFAELSKLSAKMVDLSVQEAQRDLTLRGTVPSKLNAISSPFLWPSVQTVTQLPIENTGRPGTAPQPAVAGATSLNPPQADGTPRGLRIANLADLYSRATIILREMTNYWDEIPRRLNSWLARLRLTGFTVVGNLRGYWKSGQKDHRLATFRALILGRLTIAVQRTERIALLIGRWSVWATTGQFLAKRLSARLKILTHSQLLRRLRYACRKTVRFQFAMTYRCRDCGKGIGFRSRPRTLMERYILPLTLMRPVRCAECFRRDFCLIFTPVRERLQSSDENPSATIHSNVHGRESGRSASRGSP
jgi:hypothetical protein